MAFYRCGGGREGTAVAGDVLTGKTFTNANDVNIAGTMPNRGAWTSGTSGNGNVAIPAGYHNGSGYVSGAGAYNAGVAATKKGTAAASQVLSGTTFTNASGVNIAGTMPNKAAAMVDASAASADANYAYMRIPTAGYYDTYSYIRTAKNNVAPTVQIFNGGSVTGNSFTIDTGISGLVANRNVFIVECGAGSGGQELGFFYATTRLSVSGTKVTVTATSDTNPITELYAIIAVLV